jgi:hypothetical protein
MIWPLVSSTGATTDAANIKCNYNKRETEKKKKTKRGLVGCFRTKDEKRMVSIEKKKEKRYYIP